MVPPSDLSGHATLRSRTRIRTPVPVSVAPSHPAAFATRPLPALNSAVSDGLELDTASRVWPHDVIAVIVVLEGGVFLARKSIGALKSADIQLANRVACACYPTGHLPPSVRLKTIRRFNLDSDDDDYHCNSIATATASNYE